MLIHVTDKQHNISHIYTYNVLMGDTTLLPPTDKCFQIVRIMGANHHDHPRMAIDTLVYQDTLTRGSRWVHGHPKFYPGWPQLLWCTRIL